MSRSALIVDDSASMRSLVRDTLVAVGFSTVEADNGQVALEKAAQAGKFDLVVTDLNMPILDGISFVQKLRTMPAFKFTPVLLLTTETRTDQKDKAKAAGATGWLTKPFDPSKLRAVVQKVLP